MKQSKFPSPKFEESTATYIINAQRSIKFYIIL